MSEDRGINPLLQLQGRAAVGDEQEHDHEHETPLWFCSQLSALNSIVPVLQARQAGRRVAEAIQLNPHAIHQ